MKIVFSVLLLTPYLLFSQAKTSQELKNMGLKKYPIESAEITYLISGDGEGEETMVFTDYGWTSLRKQTITFELYGISSTQTIYEITDGDFVYRLNENDSTYTLRKDLKWSQQAAYKTPDQVSEAILFSMGGIQQPDSSCMDKTCQVWTFEGKAIQELWLWKGLVMKRIAKLGDRKITTESTKVLLDISPNPIIFTIPEYYTEKK